MLATALGTEMASVLGVVTGFFAGMAAGALLLDGPIRRSARPGLAYAALEATLCVWAAASAFLLPGAAQALTVLLGPSPPGLALWAAGFAVPAALLLPATATMGGTLIALERLLSGYGQSRVAAGVYAANTAGAVGGALLGVFVLMPAVGLTATVLLLAGVNALCAGAALLLRNAGPLHSPAGEGGSSIQRPHPTLSRGERVLAPRLIVTLFATGVLGIAAEILVVRLAAQVLQNTVFSFAVLLAAYLTGTALGGAAWQRWGGNASARARPVLLAATSGAVLLTACLVRVLGPLALAREGGELPSELAIGFLLFLLPTAAMGALFGALLQDVRDLRGSIGWAVGINAAGAACGPALAGLVLIPAIGALPALIGVGLGYLLLLPPARGSLLGMVPAGVAVALLAFPAGPLLRVPQGGAVLAVREGPTATAAVVADAGGTRFLEVNGHFRMGGTSSLRSDWREAHLPLLLRPGAERALFLGVGTGATVAGGAALPGVTATGVELSPEVVGLLPQFAGPAVPRPPDVVTADARRFVLADRGRYDVIVADLFHPALDGTGALYTAEHFQAVRGRLAPGGVFCQWLPLYQLDTPSLLAIMRAFLRAYPDATAWLAHYSLETPMLALIGGLGAIDPAGLARALDDPAARPALAQTGFDSAMDVLGLYVAGPAELAALAGSGPVNLDDKPFVTFDAERNVQALLAAPGGRLLALLRGLGPVRPPPGTEAIADRLVAYWRARDTFLEAGAALPPGLEGYALMNAAIPGLLRTVALSPEFDAAYQPLLAMAASLLQRGGGERGVGVQLLRALAGVAPSRPEARELLARVR